MRFVGVSSGLFLTLLLSGCARARVNTAVRADGAWTRTVMLTGQQKKKGQMAPTLEDTFVFASGSAWKSSEEKKDDDRTLTFERTLAACASIAASSGPPCIKLARSRSSAPQVSAI